MSQQAVIDWLLEGDPAIRWQVFCDLLDGDPARVEAERALIGETGWGRRLLDRQEENGRWSSDRGPKGFRGLYTPKWTSTHYTMLLLRRLGLPKKHPAAEAGCRALIEGAGWLPEGGIRLWERQATDVCVSAMALSIFEWFDTDVEPRERLRRFLVGAQLEDGGWNCRTKSVHGSFHTTLSALEALHLCPQSPELIRAADRGREFFLRHRLYCSHRTGKIVRSAFTRFPLPYGWQFDAMRGLDHFAQSDAPCDQRFADAIALVRKRRRVDGRWTANARASGDIHFELEPAGKPSRWVTMSCLRVLKWWESSG